MNIVGIYTYLAPSRDDYDDATFEPKPVLVDWLSS